MAKLKRSISIGPETLDKVKERGEKLSYVIDRDLTRLYAMYERALRQASLTINEASLIVEALNGVLIEPSTVKYLSSEIKDAVQMRGLNQKWKVDVDKLLNKVKGEFQWLAIADAAERCGQQASREDLHEVVKKFFYVQ